jgi:hypothetical protein
MQAGQNAQTALGIRAKAQAPDQVALGDKLLANSGVPSRPTMNEE